MEYDYASDEAYHGRVLWGRLGVYAAILLVVFLLGSWFGGRGTVPAADLQARDDRIAQLIEENETYEQEIAALSANAASRPRVPDDTDDLAASAAADDGDAAGEGEGGADGDTPGSYTVQPEDTLYDIAVKVYGDGSKFRAIAEANNLDSNNRLQVGQTLVIPPGE
jgi:5'-nucleotidase / UDP-sugar diphosphatase